LWSKIAARSLKPPALPVDSICPSDVLANVHRQSRWLT
jgi:hypothetical protein